MNNICRAQMISKIQVWLAQHQYLQFQQVLFLLLCIYIIVFSIIYNFKMQSPTRQNDRAKISEQSGIYFEQELTQGKRMQISLYSDERYETQHKTLSILRKQSSTQVNEIRTARLSFKQNLTKLFHKKQQNIIQSRQIFHKFRSENEKIKTIIKNEAEKKNQTFRIPGLIPQWEIYLFNTLSVITIIAVHFICTFQSLFEQFRSIPESFIQKIFKTCCIIVGCIKILSSLTFKFTNVGVRLQYLSEIISYYLKSIDFYLDALVVISAILLTIYDYSQEVAIFGFVATLANIVYIQRIDAGIEARFLSTTKKKQLFTAFKLLLINLFVAHLIAVVFVVTVKANPDNNWMIRYQIIRESWWIQYIYSFYWATAILVTVGFGDIIAVNIPETIIIIITMLIGCLIISYNISQMGSIIAKIEEENRLVKTKLEILKKISKVSKIDIKLQRKMSDYIIFSAEMKREFDQHKEFVDQFPMSIKQQFEKQNSQIFFAEVPFFQELQIETKCKLIDKLTYEVYSSEELVNDAAKGLTGIKILRKGKIGLACKKNGSDIDGLTLDTISVQKQSTPELLNVYLLARGKDIEYNLVCKEYSVIITLQFDDFRQILKQHTYDNELYHQYLDLDQKNAHNKWSHKICQNCNVKHSIFVYPILHFVPLQTIYYIQKSQRQRRCQDRVADFLRNKTYDKKRCSTKLYKTQFKKIQNSQNIDFLKRQIKKIRRFSQKLSQDVQVSDIQDSSSLSHFDIDDAHNYTFYFTVNNPQNLTSIGLRDKKCRK